MKKQTFTIVIALILLLTIITVSGLSSTKAETEYPAILIISPRSTVYHNSSVDVFVVVHKLVDEPYPLITRIMYSLNASDIFTYKDANFTYNGTVALPNNLTAHEYIGKATLEVLKEGNYTLRVMHGYGNTTIGGFSGSSVEFRVMYGDYEPAALISPTNQTYHSSDVPLTLTVNEPYVYVYYCLNGGKPNFINETSSTLSELPVGSNNLSVFVKFKDIYSDFRVNFTVDSDSSQNKSNGLIIFGVTAIPIILVALAFVIKRKKSPSNK